ncbi:carbohydrate ABC transporter permease [Paenibacillus roseipurpureus]|uniref:Sugar ABC transporter permease n=1 Tax=Paenibacillus roseopurpureus TaxID=2918901 RepID=A0AA96RNM3_9BACL|nr:sugar ABC transporter permease [Paenibacillus sp. MBLB1832]WNR45682.1 sugar ABC transporter permease [Paenibacillus sp. MBLB1832]
MTHTSTRLWAWLAVLPAMLLFLCFKVYPAVGTFIFSLTDFRGNINNFHWVGVENYHKVITLNKKELWNSIRISLTFSFGVTLVQNVLAIALAVLVNMKLRLRNFYRAVIFMPNVLGVVIIGFLWKLIFDPYSGPVSLFLSWFHMNSALLGSKDAALPLVMFIQLWASVGYAMVLYVSGLQDIPEHLYESASIDGATGWKKFRYVTLPMLQPMITVNLMLSIIGSLKVFDIIMILTNGGPGQATTTIGLYAFQSIFSANESQGFASALSILQFLFILFFAAIAQFILRRREAQLQ